MTRLELNTQDRFADITDPDVYVSGVPHATFKRLRDEDPVSWWDEHDGRGFWAVTRYHDILHVSHSPHLFSSARGIRLEDMAPDELKARTTMMELDPPKHTAYRRMVNPAFTPRQVATYEPVIRQMARAVIDDLHGVSEFDFVERIARQLPMRMLGSMLALPEADLPWLVRNGDALIGNADPEFTNYPVDKVDTSDYRLLPFRSPVSLELFAYAEKLAAERKANPGTDVISMLLQPKRDGEPLSDHEFKNFFTLLVAAGNDTTRYTMAAGMHALIEHPDQLALLQREPQHISTAVEEILRWGTVTMHFRRTATQDTELGGRRIRAGDKVVIWFISGDYDERQFPDPYRFDVLRKPNEHLAFGLQSPHKCLGEHLARAEIRILLEELLPRIVSIELAGPIERLRSNFISGIKHLPVRVSWRSL
ncbi:MAG: cytochrome P450 [Thermoflexales bacterium]|nr:cytochrome P450 [Thermoflexales bacterium]MDW8351898.1 cytochrome P450 [Anaerolineae bacterium]